MVQKGRIQERIGPDDWNLSHPTLRQLPPARGDGHGSDKSGVR